MKHIKTQFDDVPFVELTYLVFTACMPCGRAIVGDLGLCCCVDAMFFTHESAPFLWCFEAIITVI